MCISIIIIINIIIIIIIIINVVGISVWTPVPVLFFINVLFFGGINISFTYHTI